MSPSVVTRPMTAPGRPHVGRRRALAWIDPDSGTFRVPPTMELVRPIDVRLSSLEDEFHVIGVFDVVPARGVRAQAKSGGLSRLRTTPDPTARTCVGA